MKRYLVSILLAILVMALGVLTSCNEAALPEKEKEQFYSLGYDVGYGWGYRLIDEDKDRFDLLWAPPDTVDVVQESNPQLNIRNFYIPKGYWTMEDAADAHFPDGTPFNEKQKEQAIEAYNWGFYDGFMQGSEDCLEGKPSS